jgi:50S ribosomal protein L16 3-hydroxylase
MDVALPTTLLGGLSPQAFMRRHWQKKPLLVRRAMSGDAPPLSRQVLFALAARDDVESRLVERGASGWTLRHGPFSRRQLPPLQRPGWTLLVQGADLHADAAHDLLARFRFVPDARLDDLMISYASDGGGVGPHYDSYDVFLLQVHGRRRWRIGRLDDTRLVPDVPLKILEHFRPQEEWLLEPGDMLYLPPRWAHDGIAEGECMTCSVGFRAAARDEAGREVLQRLLEGEGTDAATRLYRDASQAATDAPARIPAALQSFGIEAALRLAQNPRGLACAVGEWLSEPKPRVSFDGGAPLRDTAGVVLDRRTKMLYDDARVYINGESYRASGADAALMRQLADRRRLHTRHLRRASDAARQLLDEWAEAGWLHAADDEREAT